MATQVQRRKGTTVQHSTFTGASAELTVDTTKNTVVVHNGATAGGFPLAKDSEVVHLTGAETVAGVKTLSSNPILSAGTANGVTYLNGSKVLTSGSALTFDGTTTLGLTVAGTGAVLNGYNITNGSASGIFKVTGSTYSYRGVGSNVLWVGGDGNPMYVGTSTDQPVLFGANAFELMRLDSSGNLGLGVTPSAFEIFTALQVKNAAMLGLNSGQSHFTHNTYFQEPGGVPTWKYIGSGNALRYSMISGQHTWSTAPSGTAGDAITFGDPKMTLDASGNFLLGKTINDETVQGTAIFANSGIEITSANTGTQYPVSFYRAGSDSAVGFISTSTSNTTSYATSSDYRLKNSITPMTGALAKVALLKPCTYKWNADGSDGEGFIAHELAEVCPQAVTGEKDAVDAEDKPQYQGIDVSFLVGTLTAAIQELNAKFEAYKASHP